MSALPMANDHDIMSAAESMAQAAVLAEGLSVDLVEQLLEIKKTQVSKTFQVRLIAPLTTATVKRLRTEGVGLPALAGFMNVGAYLTPELFVDALEDLEERHEHTALPTQTAERLARMASLAWALDFAGAREPMLSLRHLMALSAHLNLHPATARRP